MNNQLTKLRQNRMEKYLRTFSKVFLKASACSRAQGDLSGRFLVDRLNHYVPASNSKLILVGLPYSTIDFPITIFLPKIIHSNVLVVFDVPNLKQSFSPPMPSPTMPSA